MRRLQVLIFLICVAFARSASAEKDLSLMEIVARHTRAIGGESALHRIHNLQFTMRIIEPSFGVDATYIADRNFHMRIDVMAGSKRIYTEAFDGKQAWQMADEPKGAKLETESGAMILRNGILAPDRFFSLKELIESGHRITLEPREKLDSINYYVLSLDLDGTTTHLLLNPNTWLIERERQTKPIHPDNDPTPVTTETTFSDFRKVNGILRPFHSIRINLETKQVLQTEIISDIQTNVHIDEKTFIAP